MNGYMGRILWVDLTAGTVEATPLDEDLCANFIGGYGLGARLLLDRIPAGADPLGPDNVLGFVTGRSGRRMRFRMRGTPWWANRR